MSNNKYILFISHDATRTGANIALLSFLKWFKKKTDVSFKIILGNGGELLEDYQFIANTFLFSAEIKRIRPQALNHFVFSNIAKIISSYLFRCKIKSADIKLIFSNTIMNGHIIKYLSASCPVICYVHELDYWIRKSGLMNMQIIKACTTRYIAISRAVKNNLVEHHKIREDNICIVPDFIDPSFESYNAEEVFQELKISPDSFIVGMTGTLDWRKGPDLFIQLAYLLKDVCLKKTIHFIWTGGDIKSEAFYNLWDDVVKLKLQNVIHFIGSKQNPNRYASIYDVFALTSRDEPYCLAMMEAAALGKPIICFDQAGGAQEFVGTECGYVVPYIDIQTMALKIIDLLQSPESRLAFGKRAKEKIYEDHLVEKIAPQLFDIIKMLSE